MTGVSKRLRSAANRMRKASTLAQKQLWSRLRSRRFSSYKFRRQHPISSYVLDFYSPQLKLAIEVDGSHHETAWMAEYDGLRTMRLREQGIEVLRIPNVLFIRDVLLVEEIIQSVIDGIVLKRRPSSALRAPSPR